MTADLRRSRRRLAVRILAVCVVWLAFAGYVLVSGRHEPRISQASPSTVVLALELTRDAPADAFGFRPAQGLETHSPARPGRGQPEGADR